MKEKQLSLVSYEQAKRLDAIDFDYPALDWYYTLGGRFSAPTLALALKWARDEKGLYFGISPFYDGILGYYRGYEAIYPLNDNMPVFNDVFDEYESAESALLDELLNILEREKENG
jgi:hypothetical protein